MIVSNFVHRSRQLACFALFMSASMGLVSRSDAQTATAKAGINFNVISSTWFAGTATQSDDGGNYDSVGLAPNFFIKALVNFGDAPQRATLTVTQHFTAVPYTGPVPQLAYDAVASYMASTQAVMQSASAVVTHNYSSSAHAGDILGGIVISKKIVSDSQSYTEHVTITPVNGDYVDVGQLSVGASSPGNANPPGCVPGCG